MLLYKSTPTVVVRPFIYVVIFMRAVPLKNRSYANLCPVLTVLFTCNYTVLTLYLLLEATI